MDIAAVEETITKLMHLLSVGVVEGRWENDPNLQDTPRRVAEMYEEMLGGHDFEFTTSPNDGEYRYDQIVLLDKIPFTSLCMHHLTPFFGFS